MKLNKLALTTRFALSSTAALADMSEMGGMGGMR
jgi:hypothetical protein